MTFNFTEEQIMIRDMVREFTKKEVEPRDKWMDENGFDYELHKKLTQAGLMGDVYKRQTPMRTPLSRTTTATAPRYP